jgi:hypothetical protein
MPCRWAVTPPPPAPDFRTEISAGHFLHDDAGSRDLLRVRLQMGRRGRGCGRRFCGGAGVVQRAMPKPAPAAMTAMAAAASQRLRVSKLMARFRKMRANATRVRAGARWD